MVKIKSVKELIEKAIANPENVSEDGSINWCFVDADIHIWNSVHNLGFSDEQLWVGLSSFEC